MRCPSCGSENLELAETCPQCGAPLDERTEERPFYSTPPGSDPSLSRDSDSSPSSERTGGVSLAPGRSLGSRYTLVDYLGKGGMGVVYKAHDRDLDRTVAIKLIREDLSNKREMLVRFRRELGLAQLVSHPNVCRVHDLGEAEGTHYLSMEFLEGHTLADLISEVGRLSPRQTLEIGDQICRGLEAIHSQGIVHRDLKPTNIGITPSGRVVVMDFGIARRDLDLDVTGPGMMIGSYSYLAPEQIPGGKVDERTDIYCLGLLLYEMLTGRRPPGDDDRTPLAFRGKTAHCPPPGRLEAEVSRELDDLVMRCLAWSPADRFENVEAVRSAIQECRDVLSRETGPREESSRYPGISRLPRWVIPVIGGSLIAVLAYFLILFLGDGPASARPVAVLPLSFEGQEPEYAYLANMTTEALMAGLQSVPSLAVPPYETVLEFTQSGQLEERPIAELTRELGVQEVVQGKVSVDEDRFLVDLWLTTSDGENIWEASHEGNLTRPLQTVELLKKSVLEYFEITEPAVSLSQIRSPSVEAYQTYLQARDHYAQWDIEEHLEEASNLFRKAIDLDPDFAAARALLARTLVTKFYQNYDSSLVAEASQQVELASTLASELPEVLIARGFVEEVRGNSVEAEMAYKRAVELAPGNDTAFSIMGSFYADLGRHEEADDAYQRALFLRPGSWKNHYDYGRHLQIYSGELDKSRDHLKKAVEYHPNGVGPKMALGNTYLNQGELEEAATWYRRALEHRKSPWAPYNLGLVYYYQGEYELAHRSFQTALERLPNRPEFQVAVGDALRQMRQSEQAQRYYSEALSTYRRLIADQPADDENRIELVALLATLDQCDEARRELESVMNLNADSADFSSKGAYASALCGDQDEAIRLALVAIRGGDCLYARFDPALEQVRQVPEVRRALADAGLPLP